MQEFQAGFLDSGTGDPDIGKNLRRWMLEYAVLHGMPPSRAREYTNPAMMQRDAFLTALKEPETHTDEELFSALCAFAGRKLEQSPVIRKDRQRGAHLFAALWRTASGCTCRKGSHFSLPALESRKPFPGIPWPTRFTGRTHPCGYRLRAERLQSLSLPRRLLAGGTV